MTPPPAPGATGYPAGLPLALDARTRRLASGRALLGGDPGRLLRLGPRGPDVLAALAAGGAAPGDPGAAALARLLADGGLAHPTPGPVRSAVPVVVPVRDRPALLDRCLAALGPGADVLVVDDGSRDPAAVRAVCRRRGAGLLALPVTRGPAAARVAGLAATSGPVVAFLDSDCVPPPGWLDRLAGHLADPAIGAVAPRVAALPGPGAGLLARYAAARGPLDLGRSPARVRPGGRIPYVPTAALVVRRAALPSPAFDSALRYGEDVDLVWRLHDGGWVVRYDPRTVVGHAEPARWGAWLARRHAYGTSAAPLAARHGSRLTPLVLPPWPTAVWLALLAGRPGAAAFLAAVPAGRLARRLRRAGLGCGASAREAGRAVAAGVAATAGGVEGAGAAVTAPVLLALLAARRTRRAAGLALVVPPLLDWAERRPGLDPLRWTALRLVDDLAYASGVWRGCVTGRTLAPLRPRTSRPR